MDPKAVIAIVFGAGVVGAIGTVFYNRRAAEVLERWADKNGYALLEKKQHYLYFGGPFELWRTSQYQVVYSVRIRDRQGSERNGWVRCGNYWGGVLFSDKAEVRWDQES